MALQPKIPVITILGHIDHGKTTLLDALRQSQLAESEPGGITQHIGAYQLVTKVEGQNYTLAFIDTPGHAAFEKMRSRGAHAADLVILLIDAKEGVMLQTKEAIKHIKQAKVPFLVCLNKSDLPDADPQRVKQQLAEQSVFVEGYGGDIVTVSISAKNKTNLDELLQMLVLLNQLDPTKADPQATLQTLVIESSLDKNRGPLATLLIQSGTLKSKDKLFDSESGQLLGNVRQMLNEHAQNQTKAIPGQPIQVSGFKITPPIGSIITNIQKSKRSSLPPPSLNEKTSSPEAEEEENKPCLIVKADTQGTLQALVDSLPKDFIVISQGVGPVAESDILLAQSSPNSQIIAFNVVTTSAAQKLAQIEGISIITHSIIYRLLEVLDRQLKKAKQAPVEQILGRAIVLKIFSLPELTVVGCRVSQGKLSVGQTIKISRQDKIIGIAQIASIKQGVQSVEQAKANSEAGLVLDPHLEIRPKDVIIAYQIKTKKNETISHTTT
jgi:translation initiation factor IF-2